MPMWVNRFRVNNLNQLEETRLLNYNLRNNISDEEVGHEITIDFPSNNPSMVSPNEALLHSCWGQFNDISFVASPSVISERKYIKRYDYIPNKFHFNHLSGETDNLYLGIELEIDKGGEKDDVAKFIIDCLGKRSCYIKHDGSLKNGMEIVSHPSTLNFQKSLHYENLFKELTEKGYKSHDTSTCGYHIHINRNFFSEDPTIQDLCITKILYLFEKYWDDVKIIARRDSNRYAQRFNMKEEESMFELLIKAKGVYSSKYNVIDLSHDKTIEFRIFKGTLKYETFIATMEFIYNLAYLCKEIALEDIQNIKFKDILDIKPTEYLVTYIQSRSKNTK